MRKYVLITISANIIFGIMPLYWKLIDNISISYVLAQRMVWSLIFTFLIVKLSGNVRLLKEALKDRKKLFFTAMAGVIITGNWYLYIWAVNASRVMETSLAYYMTPLMVFMFGVLMFRDKCTKWEIISVGFAAAGIVLSTVQFGQLPWISVLLALSFALYAACKKAAGLDPAVSLTIEMLIILPVALVCLSMTSFGSTGELTGLSISEMLLLAGTGVISAFPLWLYSFGIKGLPFTLVGFLQYLWPSTSLLLSIFILKEQITSAKLVSFSFIWAGLIIFSLSKVLNKTVKKNDDEYSEAGLICVTES